MFLYYVTPLHLKVMINYTITYLLAKMTCLHIIITVRRALDREERSLDSHALCEVGPVNPRNLLPNRDR